MNEICKARERCNWVRAVFIAALLTGCVGCQTFNSREEDWQGHWSGEADPQVGDTVAIAGTAAYFRWMLGSLFH